MTPRQIHGPGAAVIRLDRSTSSVPGSGGAIVVPNQFTAPCPLAGSRGTYSN
jgi:hypothetical protein